MAFKRNALPPVQWTNPVHWLALGFGTGYSPVAPGTFGTLSGVLVFWLLFPVHHSQLILLVIILLLFVGGVFICDRAAKDWGEHDHGCIVWDELVGYLVTMWGVMWVVPQPSWLWVVIAFVAFRLFDIAKPWPIKWVDRSVHGGFGIMIDDLLAGVMAALSLVAVLEIKHIAFG